MQIVRRTLCDSHLLVQLLAVALLVFGLLALTSHAALAAGGQTGNLNGTVTDAATKAPIANAVVTVASPSGTFRAHTDAHGFFSILGISVDSYTVSVQVPGYDDVTVTGVTIVGDQNLSLGTLALTKRLKEIGRVAARSRSSAFQPNQTVDSVTITGERAIQTTGKAASTNEQALILAAPGTSVTAQGNVTIRGGLSTEVGYQLDGVDYTEPFFTQNATNGKFNGLGALQVVEGAGDATQGNVGGGVVNFIPKRGTQPAFGLLDFEADSPNYSHQFSFEYGFATSNGRFSDYIAYNGQRYVPYYGYHGSDTAAYGNFYGISYETNDDLINNFIFKFGKTNNQSFQILYQNRDLQQYGNAGGLAGQAFYPFDPSTYVPVGLDSLYGGASTFQRLIGLNPGTPATNVAPFGPEEVTFNPTRFLKFEYTNSFDASTFLAVRTYNWNTLQGGPNSLVAGNADPTWQQTGGSRSGVSFELTKQVSQKHVLTLAGKYENQHPIWDDYSPYELAQLLAPVGGASSSSSFPSSGVNPGVPWVGDFVEPVGGICPITGGPPSINGCYLAKYFPNGIPRLPISGINYHQADFQTFAYALRDQWSPTSRLKLDLGLRVDGANYKFGPNPFYSNLANPSDVPAAYLADQFMKPRDLEPRAAITYELSRNDALRFGYGRSVVFLNAQTAGTPATLYNAAPFLKVPATDSNASPACGSGTNTDRPNLFFKCPNYAAELLWLYDQNFDAPDIGNTREATYSNYDLTYQHQYRNGWGMRFTPFYKLGSNLPSFALLSEKIDPVTGQILSEVFNSNNIALNRTTGIEFGLTTPDRETGLSGFLSMTYQNVLGSTPPLIAGEDNLPLNGSGSLALGDVYRAGYVSPFVARVGVSYKTASGLRINPIFQFDRGYPYNVGDTIASGQAIFGQFYNIPQVNFGAGVTQIGGFTGVTGPALATNFVDPAYPGNAFHPNIAATRGTAETPSAGGVLSRPALNTDLSIEYERGHHTVGVLISNLFGNVYYGNNPTVNPYYQPVSTGVAGPQTGIPPQSNPLYAGGIYANRGFAPIPASAYGTQGYVIVPNEPTHFNFYYQLAL